MDHDVAAEFQILSNILLVLAYDAGGRLEIPRERWQDIHKLTARRFHDEESDTDVIEIMSNKQSEVLM